MGQKVKLPSGKTLEVEDAPFEMARNLEMVITEEIRSMKFQPDLDVMGQLMKEGFLIALSSRKIDDALWECMKRCTYENIKISKATFEPVEAREDFHDVCFEVAQQNIRPFTKNLFAKFKDLSKDLAAQFPA